MAPVKSDQLKVPLATIRALVAGDLGVDEERTIQLMPIIAVEQIAIELQTEKDIRLAMLAKG